MDPYKVLGVDTDATPDQIKRAYKSLALQWHPDKNKSPGAEQRFKDLAKAFDVLSDPDKRDAFDRTGSVDEVYTNVNAGPGAFNFHSMFASMFDMPQHIFNVTTHVPPEETIDVDVSLKELRDGCTKRIEFEQPERCSACAGCGFERVRRCGSCAGKGRVSVVQLPGMPFVMHVPNGSPCNSCRGLGMLKADGDSPKCQPCAGRGVVYKRRSYDVRIAAGVADGHVVLLRGKGDRGHGDVVIRVCHKFEEGVEVDKATGDVNTRITLSLAEVMCGFDKNVSLSHIGTVTVACPSYRNPTDPMVFDNMGVRPNSKLRVHFEVEYPNDSQPLVKYKDVLIRVFSRGNKQQQL